MKTEWDPNEWQGRSERKVKSNQEAAGFAVLALLALMLFSFIMHILSKL